MATQKELNLKLAKDWLAWIDGKIADGKPWNGEISNFDKLSMPFTTSGNPTWGELYARLIANDFTPNGGKTEELVTLAPAASSRQVQENNKAKKFVQENKNNKKDTPVYNTFGSADSVPNAFDAYAITPDGIQRPGTDADGKPTVDTILFVSTVDANGNVQPKEYLDEGKAVEAFTAKYSTPEAWDSLMKTLVEKNFLKPGQEKNGLWYEGVVKFLNEYTQKVVTDKRFSPKANALDDKAFLTSYSNSLGGGNATVSRNLSTRTEAKQILDSYLNDLIGRKASKEEEDAFYKELHGKEYAATRVTKNGTSVGAGGLSSTETLLIAANVAKKALVGTDVEQLLSTAKGSTAATDIAKLQEYAAAYGVTLSAPDALKYVAAGLGQKDYLVKQEERIRQTAIVLHPQLKEHLIAGGTVKDIADQFAYTKAKKLGVAVPVSTVDKDVMDAVTRGISTTDFSRELQAKPEWRTSDEAHTMVNDFINTLSKTWGLG